MKKVRAPKAIISDYLTPNKVYEVEKTIDYTPQNGTSFHITNDNGVNIFCLERNCDHLNMQDWIIEQ